jgi:hypothetical protein
MVYNFQKKMHSSAFQIFILLFFVSNKAWAQLSDFSIGLGNLTSYVNKVQIDDSGNKSTFEFHPYLTSYLKIDLPIENFGLFPQFGILFPEHGKDKEISKIHYFLLGDIGYTIHKFLLRAGAGFYMTRISSSGGNQSLPNGNGTTAFYMPENSTTSRNLIANLGFHFLLHPNFSINTHLFGFNLNDSADRAFSYAFALNYHFDDLIKKLKSLKEGKNDNDPQNNPSQQFIPEPKKN